MSQFDLGTYGAEIVLNSTEFEAGMQTAEQSIQGTEGKIKGFAGSIGGIAAGAIAGLGAALVGVGVAGTKMAGDLNKSLNDLQIQTGLTDEEMQGMGDSIKNIYNANLGESFEEISSAMATAQQNTGQFGEELESTAKNALLLSEKMDLDVNESTRSAKALMENFGISSEESFNLMAQGVQNGANKNGDLLDTFNEYSPAMRSLGFSAEQFTNILIDGAENGAFSIDKVGDAMKEFNIRAKDGSKASAEGFEILGLNAEKMTSQFAKGGDSAQKAFQKVVQELTKIEDPVQKNAAAVALFGTMAEDLEIGAIESFANIGDSASLMNDALGKINEIKYDSFGEAVQGIGRNFQTGLLLPLGEMVLPLLNDFAQWINSKMPVLQDVFAKVFDKIHSVSSKVHDFFKDKLLPIYSKGEEEVKRIFPAVQSIFEKVFSGMVKVGTSLWTFFKERLLPIYLNLYDWIKGHMPTIQQTVSNVFSAIVRVGQKLWGFFKEELLPILGSYYDYIQSKMPQAKSIVEKAFGAIKNVVETVWDIFENVLLPALKLLWDFIKPTFPLIGKVIKTALDIVIGVVKTTIDIFEKVTDAIKTAVDWLTFWNDKPAKNKSVNVHTNYTSSGNRSGGFGGVPQYAVGTPFVPNDQLAFVHKGEAIIPAKYNPYNKNNNARKQGISGEGDQNVTMNNSIVFNVNGQLTNQDIEKASKQMFKTIDREMTRRGARKF